jgi:aspartokinase
MANITDIVEKLISEKPFVQEGLSRGIINHAALAEELIPLIEKELKHKVKFSAVNMAIRRLSEKMTKSVMAEVSFDEFTDISLRTDLAEITLFHHIDSNKIIQQLYALVDLKSGDFLSITQGMHELMIITNDRYFEKIKKLLPKDIIKHSMKDLCSITVNIPTQTTNTFGLFYISTRALNWENVNIIDIISTHTEMTFIVREEDSGRALEALKRLIKE